MIDQGKFPALYLDRKPTSLRLKVISLALSSLRIMKKNLAYPLK